MPYSVCRDLQQRAHVLDGVLCRAEIRVNLTASGDPRPVAAEIVSGSYFPVLGVGPALGRLIGPADDTAPGAVPSWCSRMTSGRPSSAPPPISSAARS
jgi:hypothetical protein